jgi:ATP-dependent helicase/nuclease subunit A
LYQTLLLQARTVQIRTFHSWFAALLRSAPLQVLAELGLPARYELLEDTADAVAEAWRGLLDAIDADAGLRADYAALVAALGRARARGAGGRAGAARGVALADGAGHVDEAVAPFDAVYPRLAGVDRRPTGCCCARAGASCWPPPRAPGAAGTHLCRQGRRAGRRRAGPRLGRRGGRAVHAKGEPRAFGKSRPAEVTAAQDEVQAIVAACRQHEARPTTSAWRA